MTIDLEAIRARDAALKQYADGYLMPADVDRRALLAYVDELREAAGKTLRLLDYADVSDDCQYGTISTGTVRELLANLLRLLEEGKP